MGVLQVSDNVLQLLTHFSNVLESANVKKETWSKVFKISYVRNKIITRYGLCKIPKLLTIFLNKQLEKFKI